MLYLIPGAALAAAWAATWWRCRTLTRALARQAVTARLTDAAWARDVAALEQSARRAAEQSAREAGVLREARAVVDAALAATGSELPRGGTDG